MPNTFPSGLIGDVVSFNYRRRLNSLRETWHDLCVRTIDGIAKIGKFTDEEKELVFKMQASLKTLTSGRWLWVGGTEWVDRPENFAGAYNCQSSNITDWAAFGYAMNFAMMGTGTGGVLEDKYISQLPTIRNRLNVKVVGEIGAVPVGSRLEDTLFSYNEMCDEIVIIVGDSRKGWVTAYQAILELSSKDIASKHLDITIDVSNVRPNGEKLKSFGGTANPVKLPEMFPRIANILNKAIGRKLTSVECCLLMDEAAVVIVAGSIRRSAGMRQGDANDVAFSVAKDNLWQNIDGQWRIDPERDALRMANHTRVFHRKPTEQECLDSVRKQYHSGEGAIQWAGEAISRANADILTPKSKLQFLELYNSGDTEQLMSFVQQRMYDKYGKALERELAHRLERYGLNPCLTRDTLVLTSKGAERIQDLVGKTVTIFDGQNWVEVDNFRITGYGQDVYKVTLASGDSIKATPYHTFILEDGTRKPLSELVVGEKLKDAFLKGSINDLAVTSIEYHDNVAEVYCCTVPTTNSFTLANGVLTGNCGEIIGSSFFCNLSEVHLNQLDPHNHNEQEEAFRAATLSVCALLHHDLSALGERFAYSREIDPIIGVSFTGLFDFFVNLFGRDWLDWWAAGRPSSYINLEEKLGDLEALNNYGSFEYLSDWFKYVETDYLKRWRSIVEQTAKEYCYRHGLRLPNRCTTTQPAGCLDRTALRIFDQGLLYADEVVGEGSGETIGLDLSVRNGIPANTAIANQPLNLVKVTLENGRILRMTPNHRLSIAGKWVRADQMQKGMKIDYSLGEYHHNEDALLLSVNPDHYTREYRQRTVGHNRGLLSATIATPTMLNPELAYFLGCIFGNGSMGRDQGRVRIAFNTQDMGFAQKLQEIGKRQFGLEGKISYDSRSESKAELCFSSKQLFDWLCLNQLQKTSSKELDRIPLAIRKSSRETILAFFCGLIDTDGCVREKGCLSIDSASEVFVRNLQQVGEAVGLCFSVFHNVHGQNLQGQKDMWGLCLSRMLSNADSLAYLNTHSRKCQSRPLATPKRQFAFYPYQIASIEFESIPDYSYDFAVSGVDDNDSWYWQGSIKSHNTKSLLTGASAGWHPAHAPRFIRRVTKRVNDPIALAAIALGYSVVPAQTDKDENGNLLSDPYDSRCTEWLIEIPVSVPWADIADGIDFNFSALAQFDFYMQVQQHYTTHNTSATISLRESEIEPLANAIYESIKNDTGYISAALLARFDENETFPRLPFEAIDKATYEKLMAEVNQRATLADFNEALALFDNGKSYSPEVSACEGMKCEMGGAIDDAKASAKGFEVEFV